MTLNSKDNWLLKRLEMTLAAQNPSPRFSEIQPLDKKSNFKTIMINTTTISDLNNNSNNSDNRNEAAPHLMCPFQKIKSPKIENFILSEGQIMEAS